MAHSLGMVFDPDAESAVRAMWKHLETVEVPNPGSRAGQRPQVTLAMASAIPSSTRKALRTEFARLSIPDLWLYTLGTFPGGEPTLFLGAVADTELLALHSAVHDVLAGQVTSPSAAHFPGAWVPHCVLAEGVTDQEVRTGFAVMAAVEPVRARVDAIGVTDTRTGEFEPLISTADATVR